MHGVDVVDDTSDGDYGHVHNHGFCAMKPQTRAQPNVVGVNVFAIINDSDVINENENVLKQMVDNVGGGG